MRTSRRIRELETEFRPDWASFFILCPMPGTAQYEEFRRTGAIYERNLDRFDGTCLTWRHPQLSETELADVLFSAYRRFYKMSAVVGRAKHVPGVLNRVQRLGAQLFHLFCGFVRYHPLSGGIGRVKLDHERDYLPLRNAVLGDRYLPLPVSLHIT